MKKRKPHEVHHFIAGERIKLRKNMCAEDVLSFGSTGGKNGRTTRVFSPVVRARMRAARRQVKSLKIPSAVYGGGSGAGGAGGGVSLGAAAAWPCRGVCCAGSGEPGELAGRSRGGPVAWACRGCAGGGERGELATRAGGGSESMVPRAGEAERDGGRRAEAESTPRKCPLTGVLQCFFF